MFITWTWTSLIRWTKEVTFQNLFSYLNWVTADQNRAHPFLKYYYLCNTSRVWHHWEGTTQLKKWIVTPTMAGRVFMSHITMCLSFLTSFIFLGFPFVSAVLIRKTETESNKKVLVNWEDFKIRKLLAVIGWASEGSTTETGYPRYLS